MNDDADLLRSYVEHRSDDAFTAIVDRHIGLVYSTALRRVGRDAHLAEDVTQTVFIDLARKAAGLRDRSSLGGWLYLSAKNVSAAVVRRESRRKLRESTAQSMHLADALDSPEADPSRLRPVLDDAIVQLRDEEREAIVLRFFEKHTFSEIGAALLVSEEAARKRVDRALEKLHVVLTRRGVTSTLAALGTTLTATGTTAVPAGLAAQVSTMALANATVIAASIFATLSSVLVPAAAALALGAVAILPLRRANDAAAAEIARLNRAAPDAAGLRFENRRLALDLAEARDLRRAAAEIPGLHAKLASLPPPPPTAPDVKPVTAPYVATVTTQGTLLWNNQRITLDNYLHQLRIVEPRENKEGLLLVIRANGATFSQMTYALDEARKAGISRLVVESDAAPDPSAPGTWF